jgi:hypothetical protein
MSALGQKRTLEQARVMSALPPKADIRRHAITCPLSTHMADNDMALRWHFRRQRRFQRFWVVKARALVRVRVARQLEKRIRDCHPSSVRRGANKGVPWEIWRAPRFPSCKLTKRRRVTARS